MYLGLILGSLVALTGASVAGAVAGKVAAVVAVALFILAVFVRFFLVAQRPERTWYDGRAIAESVKTLAWRYAVGGNPFSTSLTDAEADRRYIELVQTLLSSLRDVYVPASGRAGAVTEDMHATRRLPLEERRARYLEGRLDDQQRWYTGRAASNQRRYALWGVATLALEFAGIVGGILLIAFDTGIDALSIFAAAAAAGIAWLETNQYATLAHSYANAAHELGNLRALASHSASDEDWGNFVATAEQAISREHVSWAAAGGSAVADLLRDLGRDRPVQR